MVGPPGAGQVDAGARLPSILPPLVAARAAGSLDDRLDRRRARRRQADRPAARSARRIIPPRWRRWSAAACAPGRARFRSPITASSSSTSCRNSRRRCSIRCASRSRPARCVIARANHRVSYPARIQLDRGDEPLPLRHGRRAGPCLPARPALRRRLPGAHLRAAARPHRHPHRRAGGLGRAT